MGRRSLHHYIPKFYLKRFSVNEEGNHIGLYNHNNSLFVPNADLRSQCREKFLYGKDDEIEDALAKFEASIGTLFDHWTNHKTLITPPQNSNGLKAIKRFILFQLVRTPKAGKSYLEAVNKAFQSYVKITKPEHAEKAKNYTVSHPDPVLMAFAQVKDKEHLLNFLDCKFLVNLSPFPFITSDAPVILYNQLMEKHELYRGSTALAAKGLQIFYPIHPRLMLCLFDENVYDSGGVLHCMETSSIEEVHQLNLLQYLYSDEQLFFDETIPVEYIELLVNNYERPDMSKHFNDELIHSGGKRYLLSSFEDPKINLKLSFLNIKGDVPVAKELFQIRHPSFIRK